MQEDTHLVSGKENFLKDQQTNTGGVRTYGSHMRRLEEGIPLEEGVYRFEIDTPYDDITYTRGVFTFGFAHVEWLTPGKHSLGYYIKNISFRPKKAIVDVLIVHENVDVIAVNINCRIVNSPDTPL